MYLKKPIRVGFKELGLTAHPRPLPIRDTQHTLMSLSRSLGAEGEAVHCP